MAVCTDRGVALRDTATWMLLGELPLQQSQSVQFEDGGDHVLIGHRHGLQSYRLKQENFQIQFVPSRSIALPEGFVPCHLSRSADGNTVSAGLLPPAEQATAGKLMLLQRGETKPRLLQGHFGLQFNSVSPDGKWVAAGNWNGQGACVWDVASGEVAHRIETMGGCVVAFSPDGGRLATADVDSLSFWEVGTWKLLLQKPRASLVGALAFSPEGEILASTGNDASVELIDPKSGNSLATLSTNDEPTYVSWMTFRPDGSQLAICLSGEGLRVCNLTNLRERLRDIGLDWE